MKRLCLYFMIATFGVLLTACNRSQKEVQQTTEKTMTEEKKSVSTVDNLADRIISRYQKMGLEITDNQKVQMRQIVESSFPETSEISKEEMKKIRQEINNTVLTPEQQQLVKQKQAERKKQ